MSTVDPKQLLSLFHELCNCWSELGKGNEDECLWLVDQLERMRQRLLSCSNENEGLKNIVSTYESELVSKRHDLKLTKDQLADARAQIASLISSKKSVESDRVELERQIELVRYLLKPDLCGLREEDQRKLAFLNEKPSRMEMHRPAGHSLSMLSDDQDIDYDKTGDSLDEEDDVSVLRNGRRWSRSAQNRKRSRSVPKMKPQSPIQEEQGEDIEQPRKRSKEDMENHDYGEEIVATTTVTVPYNSVATANLEVKRRSFNRSFSEPHLAEKSPAAPALLSRPYMTSAADLVSPSALSPNIQSWVRGEPLNSRSHTMITKTCLKPDYCDACGNRVNFAKTAYKCNDCRFTCHADCRNRAPVPCVPRLATPKKDGIKGRPLLSFVPTAPPMIPHIIIHCVTELERRGLDSVGIYRIPGSEKQVQDLLQKFITMRGVPNLREIDDPAVITGCIKKFLQNLSQPLIPSTSWQEFVRAAEKTQISPYEGYSDLKKAIIELPYPNRDTLSYLCTHWLAVAELSEINRMPVENLAKLLGPITVGYSTGAGILQMSRALEETAKQELVMRAFLSLPQEYWREQYTYNSVPLVSPAGRTPEALNTMLGSVYSVSNLTPRNRMGTTPRSIKNSSQRRFFNQPWK